MTGLLSAWHNWQQRREILRDMRRQQADNSERDRFVVRDLLDEALSAIALNDRNKATTIWNSARERYPAEARVCTLALDLLLKLGYYDEAEALMQEGRKKQPQEIYFARGLANIAQTRGNHELAIERYAALRKQFPGVAQGYILGAQSLAAVGRVQEADALTKRAMKQFPTDIGGFLEYARSAVRRQDWPEALQRWQIIQDAFNGLPFGCYGRAQALIKLGRYDEADELLTAGRIRFPAETGLNAEFARCAQARGDFPEALKRWKRRIERAPMDIHGYAETATALAEMGEYVEAEAILRAGIDRFPLETGPMIALGRFFHERQDFEREAEAWGTLCQVLPDNGEYYARSADALRRAGHPGKADALMEEYRTRPQG